MKSTGIVRKIDQLGRVVFPVELRKKLNLGIDDPVDIFVEEDKILFKKHETDCIFCGETDNLKVFHEKLICEKCRKELLKGML